jgi:hypothetical protein
LVWYYSSSYFNILFLPLQLTSPSFFPAFYRVKEKKQEWKKETDREDFSESDASLARSVPLFRDLL